ncbi:MAG: UpxY family transcription antiterminator [Lewinellaceae bacterium]|nr:UpxY family transcription antiterminator [Lewinellaceae bacterium]
MSSLHKRSASGVVNHIHESEPRWFAVYTRAKSEKFVQRMLNKKGIHAWLPLQKLLRRYARSTRLTEKPLINCYIFVKIVKEQYVPVLETENVAGFVKFSKNLIAIPDIEIDLLKRITLEEGLDIEAIPGTFEEGDPVEISAGNLTGMKGMIVKTEGKRRFQVALGQLGYSLLITVDAAFLEKRGLVFEIHPA